MNPLTASSICCDPGFIPPLPVPPILPTSDAEERDADVEDAAVAAREEGAAAPGVVRAFGW